MLRLMSHVRIQAIAGSCMHQALDESPKYEPKAQVLMPEAGTFPLIAQQQARRLHMLCEIDLTIQGLQLQHAQHALRGMPHKATHQAVYDNSDALGCRHNAHTQDHQGTCISPCHPDAGRCSGTNICR